MRAILALFVASIAWHSQLNCDASPEKAKERAQRDAQRDAWEKELKMMLDELVADDLISEKLNGMIEKVDKMSFDDSKLWEEEDYKELPTNRRECRLGHTLSRYRHYVEWHKFNGDGEKESFLACLKTAFGKEVGTFFVEYELRLIMKEAMGEGNRAELEAQFDRIMILLRRNSTYCVMKYVKDAKNKLLAKIGPQEKKKLSRAEVEAIIGPIKRNIFENELQAKIAGFAKSPVYADQYAMFLAYIQKYWPQMDKNMQRNKLGKALEKVNKKNKEILQQFEKTLREFGNVTKELSEKFYKFRNAYKQKLEGIAGKTDDGKKKLAKMKEEYVKNVQKIAMENYFKKLERIFEKEPQGTEQLRQIKEKYPQNLEKSAADLAKIGTQTEGGKEKVRQISEDHQKNLREIDVGYLSEYRDERRTKARDYVDELKLLIECQTGGGKNELQAIDAEYQAELRGMVQEIKNAYAKVTMDLESAGFFDEWLFTGINAKKATEREKTEEGRAEILVNDDWGVWREVNSAKEQFEKAAAFIEKKMGENAQNGGDENEKRGAKGKLKALNREGRKRKVGRQTLLLPAEENG